MGENGDKKESTYFELESKLAGEKKIERVFTR